MRVLSYLLILALIAAVSSTACHHKKIHKKHQCALGKPSYTRPAHGKKCLAVFGFIAKGLKPSLKISIGTFNYFARKTIAKTVDKALDAVIHLSKAIGLILNVWVQTIGSIFANIIMAMSRVVFCLLGSPWDGGKYVSKFFGGKSCKAPAICGKEYGRRFGWRQFVGKYESHRDILDFYGLVDLDIDEIFRINLGVGISGLSRNKRYVAESIVSLYKLVTRDLKHWKRDDIVIANRYMITIAGIIGKGYHASAGIDVVDGLILYINAGFKASGFADISTYRSDIVKVIDSCKAESFNGAIVSLYKNDDDDDDDSGKKVIDNNDNNSKNNNNNNNSNDSKDEIDSSSKKTKSTAKKVTATKTTSVSGETDNEQNSSSNVSSTSVSDNSENTSNGSKSSTVTTTNTASAQQYNSYKTSSKYETVDTWEEIKEDQEEETTTSSASDESSTN